MEMTKKGVQGQQENHSLNQYVVFF